MRRDSVGDHPGHILLPPKTARRPATIVCMTMAARIMPIGRSAIAITFGGNERAR